MIGSLFDDMDPILFEELNADNVRNSVAPFAGHSCAEDDSRFSQWKLNPDEEFAFGAAMQAATSGKGFSEVQETMEIVSLFDGMESFSRS